MDKKETNKAYLQKELVRLKKKVNRLEAIRNQCIEIEKELNFISTHDTLTGLPCRALIKDHMAWEIAKAERNQTKLAVMVLNLDEFAAINDSYGQKTGDHLLIELAKRLTNLFRKGDTICRQWGDEFILILPDFKEEKSVNRVIEKAMDLVKKPFIFQDETISITGSMGIALYPHDGNKVDDLLQSANIAMYLAKAKGRANYQFYEQGIEDISLDL